MNQHSGACRTCGAAIVWLTTASGKAMPCNPTVLTVVDDEGTAHRGRESHFATCPTAARHRKPPAKQEARP